MKPEPDEPYVDPLGDGGGQVPSKSGFAKLAQSDQLSLADAIGGPRGMVESAIPGVAFVACFSITKDLKLSAYLAVAIGAVFAVVRLAQRQSVQHAFSGLFGIAICAFIAARTGKASNVFLPGLIQNVVMLLACVVSNVIRWPVIGLIVGALTDEGRSWRHVKARRTVFVRATWLWATVFAARLIVQVPLWLNDNLVGLAIAKNAMGLPLFGIAIYLTWRMVHVAAVEDVEDVAAPGEAQHRDGEPNEPLDATGR